MCGNDTSVTRIVVNDDVLMTRDATRREIYSVFVCFESLNNGGVFAILGKYR